MIGLAFAPFVCNAMVAKNIYATVLCYCDSCVQADERCDQDEMVMAENDPTRGLYADNLTATQRFPLLSQRISVSNFGPRTTPRSSQPPQSGMLKAASCELWKDGSRETHLAEGSFDRSCHSCRGVRRRFRPRNRHQRCSPHKPISLRDSVSKSEPL